MRVLFWDCQRWHLLSGHPEKEISEKGKKSKVIPNSAVLFHFSLPPQGRGAFKEIPFQRKGHTHTPTPTHNCSQLCTQEATKACWGLLVLSTGHWLFWVDFQTAKALYRLQGSGWDPRAAGLCSVRSGPTGTTGSRQLISLAVLCCHQKDRNCFPLCKDQISWSKGWPLSLIYSSRSNAMTCKATGRVVGQNPAFSDPLSATACSPGLWDLAVVG